MKKLLLGVLFINYLFSGTIHIAISSNLSFIIDKLIHKFHLINPDIYIKKSIGSSGKLTAQIIHGSPYQLFLSADMDYPNILYNKGFAKVTPVVYAKGKLALLSRKNIDLKRGLILLLDKEVHKIAIANPKTAPYGKASLDAIKNFGIFKSVEKKIIYGESISQTLIYSMRATDIGIVAKSSLYKSSIKKYNWIEINQTLYKPIEQGMVVLNKGFNNSDVWKFYNFILSNIGQEIFHKYGY